MLEFECSALTDEQEAFIEEWYENNGAGHMMVYDEEARDDEVRLRIEDSLWAFNTDFLSSETGLPDAVFKALQSLGEDGNDAVKALIEVTCGLQEIIDEAVRMDGYGHFLSSWDGNEIELEAGGERFYVYRQ